jgi:hypothetical protein
MKRITRKKRLSKEDAAKYNLIREQISKEFPAVSEYHIQTTHDNRSEIREKLSPLGVVVDLWPDGSFNFKVYDNQCEDELIETLEALDIEFELI